MNTRRAASRHGFRKTVSMGNASLMRGEGSLRAEDGFDKKKINKVKSRLFPETCVCV